MAASASHPALLARELVDVAAELAAAPDAATLLAVLQHRARVLAPADAVLVAVAPAMAPPAGLLRADGVRDATTARLRDLLGAASDGGLLRGRATTRRDDVGTDAAASAASADPAIAVLAGEGVRTVLAVPLRSGSEAIGTIVLARRSRRAFADHEVERIELLADLAGPLYVRDVERGDLGARVQALEGAQRDAIERLGASEGVVAMEQELLQAMLPSVRREAFAERLSRALGFPIWLVDAGMPLWDQALPSAFAGAVADQLSRTRTGSDPVVAATTADGAELTWLTVGVQGAVLGGVATDATMTEPRRERLRHARAATAAYLAWMRSTRELRFREQVELVEELLSLTDADDSAPLSARMAAHGLTEPPFSVVVAVVAPAHRTESVTALSRGIRPGIAAVHGGEVCLIARADDSLALAERVRRLLADHGIPAAVGCDGPAVSTLAVRGHHDVARSIAGALVASGRGTEAGDRFTVGALGLLISHGGAESSRILVRRMVAAVLDHDRAQGTSLARTALIYLDANRSARDTARTLRVHENTVRQRLERIDGLLTPAWRLGPRALDHHVAFRIWATFEHLPR